MSKAIQETSLMMPTGESYRREADRIRLKKLTMLGIDFIPMKGPTIKYQDYRSFIRNRDQGFTLTMKNNEEVKVKLEEQYKIIIYYC